MSFSAPEAADSWSPGAGEAGEVSQPMETQQVRDELDPDVAWSEAWDDERYLAVDAAYEPAIEPAGLLGGAVLVLGFVSAGACAALNLALTGGQLTFFFDLCFVVICLVTAMAVRRTDLFTVGVLPPLLYAGVSGVVSVVAP